MTSPEPATYGLVEVVLRGLPVPLYREASEHSDELQREFALIHHSGAVDSGSVPARLLRLVEELNARFGAVTASTFSELEAAVARGDERIDLVYRVPRQARAAAVALGELFDEADRFCRAGEHLLTLTTPPGPLAFRQWFLGEFVAQIDGAPPTSWEQWADRVGAQT